MPFVKSYYMSLSGTAYESGKTMGGCICRDEMLYHNLCERLHWFDNYDKSVVDFKKAGVCEEKAYKYLPSYFDEIKGLTDSLGISYDKYIYYFMFDWEFHSFCSQFCILPEITSDGSVYTGHSWEWTMGTPDAGGIQTLEEDNIFVIRHNTKIPYMGFALNYIGMWNGMNKCGVSVNPTGGIPVKPIDTQKKLFNHGLLIRCILETCKSSEEALSVVMDIAPLCKGSGGGTLIIADKAGKAYYIERVDDTIEYIEVGSGSGKKYQCAANHFMNPLMFSHASQKGIHSIIRYNTLDSWIQTNSGRINMTNLMKMQSMLFPTGPCCHFYSSYLGTVRSMIFNLTEQKAKVSFGSPRLNPWNEFDFDTQMVGMHGVESAYANEEPDPGIWRHIPPDENEKSVI